jgi:hypothetical protein
MKPFERRPSGAYLAGALLALALALPALLAPRAVAGGCTEDAAGMCERPIACNPPVGGRCTTVVIPQPLTGHKFECRCLVPPPPPPPKTSTVTTPGAASATSTTGGEGGAMLQRDQASAVTAQAVIQASRTELQQMASAVRSHNQAQASAILLRHGFTPQQLQGATIKLVDQTGGGGNNLRPIRVTIQVTCCPPTIVITIHF